MAATRLISFYYFVFALARVTLKYFICLLLWRKLAQLGTGIILLLTVLLLISLIHFQPDNFFLSSIFLKILLF